MRTLLFRGQTRRYGEKLKNFSGDPMPSNWVYGGIFHQNNRGGDFSIIYSYDPIEKHVVYADTVGQYTGVDDENDTPIYEGDIVKVNVNGLYTICTVNWADIPAEFQLWQKETLKNTPTHIGFGNYPLFVIGNTYDNPELLENT